MKSEIERLKPSPLLDVRDLRTYFFTDRGVVKAVDGVSFQVYPGETLGIVGESGCGKSITALSVMRLVQRPGRIVGGQVLWKGRDLLKLTEREMMSIRGGEISMIFQDPLTALNPAIRIGEQIAETIRLHAGSQGRLSRREVWRRVAEILERVGIHPTPQRLRSYPHQFSGGMRQRVMIAIALASGPELVLADEPTTALDVTLQAQVLDLMAHIKEETGTSIVLVTHDFGVVSEFCDRVVVMYAGKVVESARRDELFADPLHPYTRGLLNSVPRIGKRGVRLVPIEGTVPEPINFPPGCRFAGRCPEAMQECREVDPPLMEVVPGRWAACHLHAKMSRGGEDLGGGEQDACAS